MSKLTDLTSKPASDSLIEHLAETVQQRLAHTHPQPGGGEDLYCLNLTSYMGERMGAVLVRLRIAEERIAAASDLIADRLDEHGLISATSALPLLKALGQAGDEA